MKTIIFSGINKKTKIFKNLHKVTDLIRENKLIFLLVSFLFVGLIFGTISARFADETMLNNMDFLFFSNFRSRLDSSILNIFIASFTSSFIFLIGMFMMGSSIWGMVLIPSIPFFRGFGLGVTAGYLYSSYGLKGIAFHFLILMPSIFISSVAIIMAAKESMIFSTRLMSKVLPNADFEKIWPDLRAYLIKIGIMITVLLSSSIVDVICTILFANKFSF